jgi:hypothetical protein
MRLAEGASSNIRSLAEATRLADAALADLSTSSLGASVEVPLHPGLELGDLVQLAPTIRFSSAQALAVRHVTHTLSSSGGKTRLLLLGQPSLSPRGWLSTEARPGIAPAAPFTGPAAPTGLSVTGSVTGSVLLFTAPTVASGSPEADSFELHVGTTPGFTLSSATLKAVSASTRFDVTGLTAGSPLYARVRSRDRKGNVGPASPEVSLAPRFVEPGMLQPRITFASSLLLNSDFEALNATDAPPDAWTIGGGAWNVDISSSTDAFTGSRSVALINNGGALLSNPVSVRPGGRYSVDVAAKVASTLAGLLVRVDWLDVGLNQIDFSNPTSNGLTTANTWQYVRTIEVAPANARYARLRIFKQGGNGALAWVDSVVFLQTETVEEPPNVVSTITGYLNGWTAYTLNGRQGASYYRDSSGRVHLEGAIRSGSIGAAAFVLPAAYRPSFIRDFAVTTSSGPGHIEVHPNGSVIVVTGSVIWTSVSGVSFRAT